MPRIKFEILRRLFGAYGRDKPFFWSPDIGMTRKEMKRLIDLKVLERGERNRGFRFTGFGQEAVDRRTSEQPDRSKGRRSSDRARPKRRGR